MKYGFTGIIAVLALLAVVAAGLLATTFGANSVAEADEPDDEVLKIVEKLIAERGGGIKLHENDKLQLPDDPKQGISYSLELADPDEEADESDTKPKSAIRFNLPVTDAHQNLNVQNKGDFALYTGDTYDIAVNASHSGFAAYVVIRNEEAPTAYEFAYALPKGFKLSEGSNGGMLVLDDQNQYIGFIEAPWAFDADGASVKTQFKLRDGVLVQTVEHADAAYPVVADPWWNLGWQVARHKLHNVERKWCEKGDNEKICIVAYGNHGTKAMTATLLYHQNWFRNNASDAFRHCYWSARMTIGMGSSTAEFILDLHEQEPGQPAAEKRMDERNNSVGSGLGSRISSYSSVRTTCRHWSFNSKGPLQLSLDDWKRFASPE